jgi:subtilisin family serine protease
MGTERTSVAGRLTPGQIVTMSRRPTDTRMDRPVTIPSQRLAAIAALLLTLAACSSETAPTGWIPSDGAIKGVITTTSVFPAPSRAAVPAAQARGDQNRVLPTPPSLASLLHRPSRTVLRARRPRGARPTATPRDLIVTFRHGALGAPPVGSAALATRESARAVGAAIRSRFAAMLPAGAAVTGVSPTILAAKVRVTDSTALDGVAALLRRDPAVATVTRNHLLWLDETAYARAGGAAAAALRVVPNDTFFAIQSWHYDLIDLPRAWTITTGNASVLVALVDDGTRFDHPALAGNLTSDGYDFVTDADTLVLCSGDTITNAADGGGYDPDPTIPASYSPDSTGKCFNPDVIGAHGVHVAGTIGAVGNDRVGVTGVNWTVKIRPVRALGVAGFGEFYDIAQGILYAAGLPADDGHGGFVKPTSGAKIINLSLGGPDTDTTLHSAIISAANAGALIVAAAGNAGTAVPHYPAAYPEVLAVAAVGPDGAPASYSSFGSYVALRAPGGNFDVGDFTDGVFSAIWDFSLGQPDYAWAEGTSMASPHVAGVAALLLAQNPALTASELRSRLTSYAVGPATQYGVGLVNAYNSLTQSHGPPTHVYALLYSGVTNEFLQRIAAQPDGSFAFSGVEAGRYFVYGATDESSDQQLGVPGRLWGALGGPATPTAISVLSPGPYAASFTIGLPAQIRPNQSFASANTLVVGGYTRAIYADTLQIDFYRVKIPVMGTYTFETSGWVSACGFALEEATAIGLFDAGQRLITVADYIDPGHFNFCSRLTRSLLAGTYYVGVAGLFNGAQYQLQARAGS